MNYHPSIVKSQKDYGCSRHPGRHLGLRKGRVRPSGPAGIMGCVSLLVVLFTGLTHGSDFGAANLMKEHDLEVGGGHGGWEASSSSPRLLRGSHNGTNMIPFRPIPHNLDDTLDSQASPPNGTDNTRPLMDLVE